MNRNMTTMLILAGAALTLPLAACHTGDRDEDRTTCRDNSAYRDTYTNHDTRYDPNDRQDHRDYDRTVHDNAADRGTGDAASTTFNRLTGNLKTTVDSGMDRTQQAAERALSDLHYVITEKKLEDNKSVIEAKSADKDKVKVTLERQTDRMTEATIGVGMTGKSSTADLILEKMLENLK